MSQRSVYERASQEEQFRDMLKAHGAYGRVQKVQRAQAAYHGKTPNTSLMFSEGSVSMMEGEHSMSKASPQDHGYGHGGQNHGAKKQGSKNVNVVDEQLQARRDAIEEANSRQASKEQEIREANAKNLKKGEKGHYNFAGRRPSAELDDERNWQSARDQMASTMPVLPKIAGAQEQSIMSSTFYGGSSSMMGSSTTRSTFAQQRKLQGALFQRKTIAAIKSQAEGLGNAEDVQGLRRMLKVKYGECLIFFNFIPLSQNRSTFNHLLSQNTSTFNQ